MSDGERIKLIGEVVGGFDFQTSSDLTSPLRPYCILKLGDEIVHKTKKGEGGANPIWTVSTGSFFLFSCSIQTREQLTIEIWYKERDPLQLTVLDTFVSREDQCGSFKNPILVRRGQLVALDSVDKGNVFGLLAKTCKEVYQTTARH